MGKFVNDNVENVNTGYMAFKLEYNCYPKVSFKENVNCYYKFNRVHKLSTKL